MTERLTVAELRNRPNKYRAKRTVRGPRTFDSRGEADRYSELVLLERAGEIRDLECQPVYSLDVNGLHVCNYRPDFRYRQGGQLVVEDFKGVRTNLYLVKRRLMEAVHGIVVLETHAPRARKARRLR